LLVGRAGTGPPIFPINYVLSPPSMLRSLQCRPTAIRVCKPFLLFPLKGMSFFVFRWRPLGMLPPPFPFSAGPLFIVRYLGNKSFSPVFADLVTTFAWGKFAVFYATQFPCFPHSRLFVPSPLSPWFPLFNPLLVSRCEVPCRGGRRFFPSLPTLLTTQICHSPFFFGTFVTSPFLDFASLWRFFVLRVVPYTHTCRSGLAHPPISFATSFCLWKPERCPWRTTLAWIFSFFPAQFAYFPASPCLSPPAS